jgi:hypothetical protein
VLTGSRGRGPFARDDSDWDARMIVTDASAREAYPSAHGDRIEIPVLTVEQFEHVAEIGTTNEWDRYSYAHAQVVIDKLDGRIAELVAAKGVLPPDAAHAIAREAFGAYANSYYRAAKNAGLGLRDAARLDAAESLSPFLTALFAMHERVRPFNKFLRWELEEFPLPSWPADDLLSRLERVTGADLAEQQRLFRDVEPLARERGLGDVIDSWEPQVPFLRGE